jgi:hypothetical protein
MKLKNRVAIIGKKVKATKPISQGERKVKPFLISRRAPGFIVRNETFVRLLFENS